MSHLAAYETRAEQIHAQLLAQLPDSIDRTVLTKAPVVMGAGEIAITSTVTFVGRDGVQE